MFEIRSRLGLNTTWRPAYVLTRGETIVVRTGSLVGLGMWWRIVWSPSFLPSFLPFFLQLIMLNQLKSHPILDVRKRSRLCGNPGWRLGLNLNNQQLTTTAARAPLLPLSTTAMLAHPRTSGPTVALKRLVGSLAAAAAF